MTRILGSVALVLLLLAGATLAAEPKPRRIISLNVCTDQLLMMLAEPERIASITYLARDPATSAMADEAERLPINYGLIEEILPLEPDLVLAGAYTTRVTVFLLQELGYRVVEVPVARGLDDIKANIAQVAEAIGERQRGEDLIRAFETALQRLEPADRRRPLAAFYWVNGFTSGDGSLAGALLDAAGYRNLAVELGYPPSSQLPLETLIEAAPDLLILGTPRDGEARANESLRHPALQEAFKATSTVRLPDRLTVCGTPRVEGAIALLVAHRGEVLAGRAR